MGAYVGRSRIHAGNVSLILNLSTGHVSPQFHVVFDETFSTVPSLKNGSVPASWKFICENNRELATYEDFNLADLWSKSERESGVKFDIQRDATNKSFQQPKDDALKNCDSEHKTDNLVSTVSQKSKSYFEAAKQNLADNNNNQTFPIRPTLEKGVVLNEGVSTVESTNTLEVVPTSESTITNEEVLTAESPTALEVVPTAESLITHEDVPTDESPTEVVGEPTAELPTPQKSLEEQAICRNARNLLVKSRHMENEGDESQVNSLSP